MSDNVLSKGFMVPLLTPILDRGEREDLVERLYDTTVLMVNYEGTLIYSNQVQHDLYGILFQAPLGVEAFLNDVEEAGLKVDSVKARSYTCFWYNGTDSDMDEMTLDQFLKETGQK